jgi:serine/threonine-protein kinase
LASTFAFDTLAKGPPGMDAAHVKQGDIIAGKYRVERVLGAGGMGIVFAVTHVERQTRRALKLLRPAALTDADAVERFLREARATLTLRGEHVARLYEVGTLNTGAPYLIIEYLEGSDLRTIVKARGALPMADAIEYLLQVCEALAEAHGHGIVHRDIKPANIFLTRRADGSPCVKVLDFGISKLEGDTDSEGSESTVTKSYTLLGSPHYMSPEQMRGAHDVDARADIWALGVTAYYLVTGRRPFEGPTPTEIMLEALEGSPEPPSRLKEGLSPELDAAIFRCLERDIESRFATVEALAAALRPLAPPAPRPAPPPAVARSEAAVAAARPRWIVPALLLLLVCVAGLVLVMVGGSHG